ncbi:MAG: beta-ketoacyl synthase N-terminal-like domain-containing protein [Mycobacteriales bacterium]
MSERDRRESERGARRAGRGWTPGWAITGTGMLSSLGDSVASSFAAYCRGETGLAPLRAFDRSKYRVTSAFEVADRQAGGDQPRRATAWLCDVIGQAATQAGLDRSAGRVPVVVGTGLAEQRSLELWWTGDTPLTVPDLDVAAAVTDSTGLGPTYLFVNACSASLFALAAGTDLLALGEVDAVVVAGSDTITESMFGLLDRVTMEAPTELRPFDVDRRGVILGEGAAAVVLEPLERARARGARPLAVLRGVGTSCDANHLTAPLLGGIGRAMRDAHRRAGLTPDDIDLVLAHGTGTLLNDETEARALGEVFAGRPDHRGRPLVTGLKSLTGHTSGASGLMSLVTAIETLASGRVTPTRHHAEPIPEISDFPVVTEPVEGADLRRAQVDAFGFGGVNAVAVLERPDGPAPAAPVPGTPRPDVAVTAVGLAVPGLDSVAELLAGEPVPPASFFPRGLLGRKGLRYKDRATLLALCAATAALDDAGLPRPRADRVDAGSFGVIVSTTTGIAETVCRVAETIHEDGVVAAAPMDLPNASGNVAAASVAIRYGLEGLNLTLSASPTSGIDALRWATVAIQAGRARRMLVIGVEPAAEAVDRLVAETAEQHGSEPPRRLDGAVAVLLESADAVAGRGGRVRALVGGYGRDEQLDAAVGAALKAADGAPPALWLTPCGGHAPTGAQVGRAGALPDLTAAARVAVGDVAGEALAALGVLQCAAALAWLGEHPGQRALLTSGGCWGGEFAGLTLAGVA